MNYTRRVFQFFRPDASRLVLVGLLILLAIGANLLKPWPLAVIIDSVLGTKPLPGGIASPLGKLSREALLAVLAFAVLALHLGQSAIASAQNFVAIRIGLNGLRRVRVEVFASLQRLSLRFHQGSSSGDIIHRAAWDTYSFQTLFQHGWITSATALLSLLGMSLWMWLLNPPLTLLALAIVPVLLLVMRGFGRRMTQRGAEAQQADSQVTSFVQQSLLALPLIQSYTREALEEHAFLARTGRAMEKRLTQHAWELFYWLAISAVFAAGTAGIVWLGSRQVLAGRLSVGELLIFLAYLAQLYEPLNQLSHVGATMANAKAGTRRVFEILDAPEEVTDAPDARALAKARGDIAFENVSFGYQPAQPVLRALSFRLGAGQSVALIGPSGVGKSTLMNLLPRFFDPSTGRVTLDGVDLRELRLKDLRRQIALVLQEPLLLPATIAENIAYGKPDAARGEIEAAARAANAAGFIAKMANGYDTVVGEGGARLSVGERQRVNLARAFLKDAPILLLDEPTSALDADSEAAVVESLFHLMKGRTTLLVAHRLSTIARVDRVLVLQDGRLAEDGTPAELRAREGYYSRVISGQVQLE